MASRGDRLLAPQPWASWFEFAIPGLPVYLDSRFELFGPEIWGEYVAIVNRNEGWQSVLDERGVTIVVVDPERTGDLGAALADEPAWHRTYGDDEGAIFVRSDR
jgi:hypothetical protein